MGGDPRLPAAFLQPGTSSFSDFLSVQAPDLLPGRRAVPQGHAGDLAPHGTTIVAATFPGGVVMAGDRRATMGNIIAQRDIEKVFPADEFSAVGIAGTAGLAVEMVRLFQTELEHYEKIEGTTLSMDGKANRLVGADPRQPRDGDAGPGRRTALRRLRPQRRRRPDLQLRRDRRPLRGDRVPLGRLRVAVRARLAEEALPRRPHRRADRAGRRAGAVRRRRRRLGDRRAGRDPPDLPGRPGDHRRRRPPDARRRGRRDRRPGDRRPDEPARRPGRAALDGGAAR